MSDGGPAIDQAGLNKLVLLACTREFSSRYKLIKPLGVGGSGVVFSALQLGMDRTVAVKFLVKLDEDDLLRFKREARLLAGLRHAHVVTPFDLGELGPYPYLVTEYLPNGSLRDRIRAGPVTLADGLRMGLDAIAGLAACHDAGFVHRDIKPANILFDAENRAKISDLGLARHDDDLAMTQTGSLVGTPRYMAPEQVRGERATPASDIYAMGLVLYETLAGRQVFMAETLPGLLQMQLQVEPDPLDEVQRSVPAGIARVVHRALAKKPEDRPASASLLYEELRRAAAEASLDVSHGSAGMLVGMTRDVSVAAAAAAAAVPVSPATPAPRPAPPSKAEPAGTRKVTAIDTQRAGRPLKVPRRRIPLALTIGVAMVSGLVSGVIVMMLARPPGGDHALAGLPQVRAGASTVRFTWQTRVASRSAVRLWPEGRRESEAVTMTAGAGEVAALDHAVVAGGLRAGTTYRFRVAFDNGTISNDSFTFQTRSEPDLVDPPVVRPVSATKAHVSWKRRAPLSPGVRVLSGRQETYCWPGAAQPDAVDVPLDPAAMNRLELCFREFETPLPATGTPERVTLPPVPGPEVARAWMRRALAGVRDDDIKRACRELIAVPYRLVKGLSRKEAPVGDELVRRLTSAQHDQVIEEVRRAGRAWLERQLERVADASETRALADVDSVLSAVAAWLADDARPPAEREELREQLAPLAALDAAGQLTAGVDVLQIDALLASRLKIERRPGRAREGGDSLIAPLGLPREWPLPIPVATFGSEQIAIMEGVMDVKTPVISFIKNAAERVAAPELAGRTGRWYRLGALSSYLHASAGLRLVVQVTNLDPSLALTFRIGKRALLVRNTLQAYPGYVDILGGFSRDKLEKYASTLTVQVMPGVLADDARTVELSVEPFTAENTQGTFATPPICWFHEIGILP